ncbi:MAG: hydrolase [Solibacillus sp.]
MSSNRCGHCSQREAQSSKSCSGCVCNQLRRLQPRTEVDLFLLGGQIIEDVVFISFDRHNCCAFFCDPTTEPGSTIIVDCQFIQAIRIEED